MDRVRSYLHRDGGNRWRLAEIELVVRILLANIAEQPFKLRPESRRERATAHHDFRPAHLAERCSSGNRQPTIQSRVDKSVLAAYSAQIGRDSDGAMRLVLLGQISLGELLMRRFRRRRAVHASASACVHAW